MWISTGLIISGLFLFYYVWYEEAEAIKLNGSKNTVEEIAKKLKGRTSYASYYGLFENQESQDIINQDLKN